MLNLVWKFSLSMFQYSAIQNLWFRKVVEQYLSDQTFSKGNYLKVKEVYTNFACCHSTDKHLHIFIRNNLERKDQRVNNIRWRNINLWSKITKITFWNVFFLRFVSNSCALSFQIGQKILVIVYLDIVLESLLWTDSFHNYSFLILARINKCEY